MRFLVAIRAAIADDQHAQMAHSPAVLTAYSSLRAALAGQGTFDPKVGAALTLASAAGAGNGYMTRIASRLARHIDTAPALRASSASFVKIFFPAMRPDSQAPVI
jgi:hypothetical protein